jgi:opacity protein-like surface antigen
MCAIPFRIAAAALAFAPAFAAADEFRPYVAIRPELAFYANPDSVPGLELETPSQKFAGVAFGADLGRHWGVELAVNVTQTNVRVPGVTDRLGEYGTWSILPQLRYRHPLLGDRLVPYAVAGAGLGIGEFQDRNALHTGIAFGGSLETTAIGAVGAGIEYFVNDNVALGFEAKHVFGFDTDVSHRGRTHRLDSDQTLLSVGLRAYLNEPPKPDAPPSKPLALGDDALRFYVVARTGAAIFADANGFPPLEAQNPARVIFGAGAGVNLGRHWGIEFSGDYWEPNLDDAALGEIGEYALWTALLHLRYRFPLGDGRIVPYAMAGGGAGWSEINDRRLPFPNYQLVQNTHMSWIGSVGGGVDVMLNRNVAVGIEARYLFGWSHDTSIGGTRGALDNDTILALAQIKMLFP